MTQDEMIEMARQANATEIGHKPPAFYFYLKDLEAFAKLVAAKERKWVELTKQELVDLRARVQEYTPIDSVKYGEAIQRAMNNALKEKNT